MPKKNVIPLCYAGFFNQTGYGQASQDYILALDRSNNYDIKIKVFGEHITRPAISDERYLLLREMQKRKISDDAIQIFHCIPTIQKRIKKLEKNIGFATFETFGPPVNWIKILNENDAIIVPSLFDYKIFNHSDLKKPIFYIPHAIDFNNYNKDVIPLNRYDRFSFLFMGTWKERKGYKQLIEAFLTEFSLEDNVQLIIKTDKPKKANLYLDKVRKQIKKPKGFAPILIELKIFNEQELPSFMKSFDCFVLATFGEGFCYPGIQSMALNVPVIITNFSGCKDYANEETATLLEPEGFILYNQMDSIPQFRNRKWAFVSVKSIRKKMREVLNNPDMVKNKANVAYNYVKERFSYGRIEQLFRKMLFSLYYG